MLSGLTTRVHKAVLTRIHRYALDRRYDERLGVHTNGIHPPNELGLRPWSEACSSEYEPTPTRVFRRLLSSLPGNLSPFVFIDLGSGKGRTLMMAAEHSFRRIEGVELSSDMHAIALKNIASVGGRGRKIVSRNINAADYKFPSERFVLFLFNPFSPAVLRPVIRNLERSLREAPREAYVLYANAKHRSILDSADMLEELPRPRHLRMIDCLVYPGP
jgi:SAM-dependent methyltransferase